jgi:hypothetical protein
MSYQLPGTLTVSTAQVPKGYIKPNDSYKPLQQVEYDLEGKTLLYSAEPFAGFSPFFALPWTIPTYTIPLQAFAWLQGMYGTYGVLLAPLGMFLSMAPHMLYLERLRLAVSKVWLMRGSHWMIELSGENLFGRVAVTKQANVRVLSPSGEPQQLAGTYAEYLDDAGQLKTDLKLELHFFIEFTEGKENQQLELSSKGKVHNPELLFALLKGLRIDDTGFRVNEDPENSLTSNVCIGGTLSPEADK